MEEEKHLDVIDYGDSRHNQPIKLQPTKMKPQKKPPHLTPREELVMIALADRELYGLDIAKAISEASQGTRSLRCGSLYPLLHGLERKKFVASRWGDEDFNERGGARRRYYRATPLGIEAIAEVDRFRQVLGGWGRG